MQQGNKERVSATDSRWQRERSGRTSDVDADSQREKGRNATKGRPTARRNSKGVFHARRTGKLEQVDHARLDLGLKNRKRADRDIATNFPQSWPRMPCARVISGRHVNNLPSPIPANHTEEKRNRARRKSLMIQVLCHFILSSHSSSRDVGYVILYKFVQSSHPNPAPCLKKQCLPCRCDVLASALAQYKTIPKQYSRLFAPNNKPKAMRPKPIRSPKTMRPKTIQSQSNAPQNQLLPKNNTSRAVRRALPSSDNSHKNAYSDPGSLQFLHCCLKWLQLSRGKFLCGP